MKPDRIIVGTDNPRTAELLRSLYDAFNRNHDRLFVMDVRSAELTKYAANAMLATKISFMNELANLAEQFGADIEHVRVGIGSDPRIGYSFIYPGCGYGGSCFPKDVKALAAAAAAAGCPAQILGAVDAVNDRQKQVLFKKIKAYFGGDLRGKVVAVWGLAFKPNTDDMREAPSIPLITALQDMGAKVRVYDPVGMEQAKSLIGNITFCNDSYSCAEGASALVIVTEWEQFRALDFDRLKGVMVQHVLVDLRNVYRPDDITRHGFVYESIGRPRK